MDHELIFADKITSRSLKELGMKYSHISSLSKFYYNDKGDLAESSDVFVQPNDLIAPTWEQVKLFLWEQYNVHFSVSMDQGKFPFYGSAYMYYKSGINPILSGNRYYTPLLAERDAIQKLVIKLHSSVL